MNCMNISSLHNGKTRVSICLSQRRLNRLPHFCDIGAAHALHLPAPRPMIRRRGPDSGGSPSGRTPGLTTPIQHHRGQGMHVKAFRYVSETVDVNGGKGDRRRSLQAAKRQNQTIK